MIKAQVEQILARAGKATPGPWWFDSYHTEFDKDHRIMFSIPDHPTDDGPFEPEQIAERSAWYNESAANANFLHHARTDLPELARAYQQAMAALLAIENHCDCSCAVLAIEGQELPCNLCKLSALLRDYHSEDGGKRD